MFIKVVKETKQRNLNEVLISMCHYQDQAKFK